MHDFAGDTHDLGHCAPLKLSRHAGQDDRGSCGLRLRTHRPDVAKRVNGSNTGHQCGVIGEAAQVIRCHDLLGIARSQHRRVRRPAGASGLACLAAELPAVRPAKPRDQLWRHIHRTWAYFPARLVPPPRIAEARQGQASWVGFGTGS